MNTANIAKHYAKLTAEERFRLILAASSRVDEAERERLVQSSEQIQISMRDHSPYAHAFHEVQFMTYIELLEDAAEFLEQNALSHTQLLENIGAAKSTRRTRDSDALAWPDWHRSGRAARGIGYLFKMKIEGWKLFCNRLGTSAVKLWEEMELPGVDRIKRAVAFAFGGLAFSSATEMTIWVNEVRPDGEPECTEADILTAEWYAAGLDGFFRKRANWWGAD